MNKKERKTKRIVIRRKHTNTTFAISNGEVIMDVTLDPYGGDAKLLALVRLTRHDWARLRNLLNTLPTEGN